jgi:hypothetical protein
MARVEVTRHLKRYFPQLEGDALELGGATVREVLDALEAHAPGIGFYLCDERGRLRQHVNVFIEDERVLDRIHLADPVGPGSRVFVLQALSGG